MTSLSRRLPVILEWGVLVLLAFGIIWRGGKGLEATWLLAGAAVFVTFVRWWLVRGKSEGVRTIPFDLWAGVMLFLAWTVLSYIFSETRNYGLDEVIRDVALVMVFFWWSGAPQRAAPTDPHGKMISRLITVIAVTTLIACMIGIAVYVLQPVNRFVGTFFDMRFHTDYWPNAWAEYLLLAWPLVFLWSGKFSRIIRIVALGIVFGCLFLSYSRGAFLVFCGQIILGVLLIGIPWILRKGIEKRSLIRAGIAGLCALLIAVALFAGVNAVRGRFHDIESVTAKATFTASEGGSSISERRAFWEQSFELSLERPFFGWGPYSFRFVHPRLQTAVFATSDHAHNIFLKLAMERGWPAALLFLFVMLRILVPAALMQIRGKGNITGLAMLLGVTGVLAHNLIDYNLQFVGIALPFWIALGLLAPAVTAHGNRKTSLRITEIVIAVLLGCITILEGRFLVLSSLGRRAEAAGDARTALAWYDRSHGQLFSRDMHLGRSNLLLMEGDEAGAGAALDDYADVNTHDARLWILWGRLAEKTGKEEEAYLAYMTAFGLGKYNYLEPLEGILRLRTEADPSALPPKEEIDGIFRAFGEAILQNTHFIALSESVETFGRVSELLQQISSADRAALQIFTQQVVQHAAEERERLSSRAPGFLW
ncbi:MAG: hypothetical protein HOO67_01350 [Candidatus Peribacteraceae bacterium]|nr:hypothetical protein [Candidatus Peribacteraceae bacterium]